MVVDLTVERLVAGGAGLAQLDGLKVFVPLAAPQERVRARLVVRKKDYAVAEVEEVLEPSPYRVEPACPLFGRCGGCQFQHLSYEGQLAVKKSIVGDALGRIGRIAAPVGDVTPSPEQWRYRNKTQYPVGFGTELKVGFYREGSHDLLDVPACLLHEGRFDRIRTAFRDALAGAGETAYDERNHRGNVRHLIIRASGTETAAIVVTRKRVLNQLVVERLASAEGVSGVVQVVNPGRTNRIMGDSQKVLFGSPELHYRILDLDFRVSPGSFFQVNTAQAEELCRKVLKLAAPQGDEVLLDLYCGVGLLSLVLVRSVAKVIGIEMEGAAVGDARFNAERNAAENVEFVAGDADRAVGALERADIVVLDPPRKGCRPETARRIAQLGPKRIVYVSCNPATLARDLRLFVELGYECCEVEPVDMFPQTFHVETVVRLERKTGAGGV